MPTFLSTHQRTSLRQFLVSRFGLDDLKDLAFDLSIDYQSLPHTTHQELARELIVFVERVGSIEDLVQAVLYRRPDNTLSQLFANVITREQEVDADHLLKRALSSEIIANLNRISEFSKHKYQVAQDSVYVDGNIAMIDHFTCMTNTFSLVETQKTLSALEKDTRDNIYLIYRGFQDISDKSNALQKAFRPWRAEQYIQTIETFEANVRPIADEICRQLVS
jgi:hypothetical protein